MPIIAYEDWRPHGKTRELITQANTIAASYAHQGYDLTLRQLYYQFVARDLIPNNQQSYDRLGYIVDKARKAGLMDWNYIVDRTRNLAGNSHWSDPGSIIRGAARGYLLDTWAGQDMRVEVWVEKEALSGVIQRAAENMDVDWFACRGYVSQSEMWRAGQRFRGYGRDGQSVTILHLGDHDPSGIDMTRDIEDRLTTYCQGDVELTVKRIALNMDQVQQYDPPPNWAKLTDSRALDYIANYGDQSWELDALPPDVLDRLITDEITALIEDPDQRQEVIDRQEHDRELLQAAADNWNYSPTFVGGTADDSDSTEFEGVADFIERQYQ